MKRILCFFCACFSFFIQSMAIDNSSLNSGREALLENVLEQSRSLDYLYVYFTDLSGTFHQVIIPTKQIESALKNGLKFDGSSVPGCGNIFNSDMHLSLDISSFFLNTSECSTKFKIARIFAYVYQEEDIPYPADPRYLLQEAISNASELNYEFYVGPEIEFFLLKKTDSGDLVPSDNVCYFGTQIDKKQEAIQLEIMQQLLNNGVVIEKLHHEVAPGQYEFSIQYGEPMKMADDLMIAKHVVKQVADTYGLIATFMPKPFLGMNGSGMHINLSVADKTTKKNLFFDGEGYGFLSSLAHHAIAGILHRITDGAIILNSSVNSFKRLVPGYEAPVYVCWAKKNRSALIRIPQINQNQPYAARAEIRSPDALCNPYLAFTFLVNSALSGIINFEPLTSAIEENLFKLTINQIKERGIMTLPYSLETALYNFENSVSMREIFNPTFVEEFVKIKTKELDRFQKSVSSWELENCL